MLACCVLSFYFFTHTEPIYGLVFMCLAIFKVIIGMLELMVSK